VVNREDRRKRPSAAYRLGISISGLTRRLYCAELGWIKEKEFVRHSLSMAAGWFVEAGQEI